MKKRGQAALEYLMTYGWALIVIVIVISVLIVVTSSTGAGVTCTSQSTSIVVTESAINLGDNGVGVTIRNATGGTISSVIATGGGAFSDQNTLSSVPAGSTAAISGLDGPLAAGDFDNGYIYIGYKTAGGLDANATILCTGKLT